MSLMMVLLSGTHCCLISTDCRYSFYCCLQDFQWHSCRQLFYETLNVQQTSDPDAQFVQGGDHGEVEGSLWVHPANFLRHWRT